MPERKKNDRVRGDRYSLNQLQSSPTPPLTRKMVKHACCSLYIMSSLHTVWCGNQCVICILQVHVVICILQVHVVICILQVHVVICILQVHVVICILQVHVGICILQVHVGICILQVHVVICILQVHVGICILQVHVGICILQVYVVDSRNAIANLALVPQYRYISAVMNKRVVRKRCTTSCTTSATIGLSSHDCNTVSVTLCTQRLMSTHYTFRSQRSARLYCCWNCYSNNFQPYFALQLVLRLHVL